jgi:hypothetical protein
MRDETNIVKEFICKFYLILRIAYSVNKSYALRNTQYSRVTCSSGISHENNKLFDRSML